MKSPFNTKIIAGLVALNALAAQAVPIAGRGDPITNPAVGGGTVENFDSGPVGTWDSLTYGDFTITGVDAPFDISPDYNGDYNTRGINSALNGFDYLPSTWRFDFATPVDAFAFNWGAADNTWTLNAYTPGGVLIESTIVPPVSGSNKGEYFGIASSGIGYATLTDNLAPFFLGDFVFIDNFTYGGGITRVPEGGATFVLLGIALIGLANFRRK